MTTKTTEQIQDNNANHKQKAIVCTCCLTLFPLIYLIGTALRTYLG